MNQNINQYNRPNWGFKFSLDYPDMSLVSDERNYNEEVVFSPYLIAQTYGDRLPVSLDINNPLSVQNQVLNYKEYNDNNIFVSLNYYNPNNLDLTCFTAQTSCDIGLTGIDNGLVSGMTGQSITFTNGLLDNSQKFDRLSFDRRLKLFQVTGYTSSNIPFSGFNKTILYEVVSKTGATGNYHELYGGFYQGFYQLFGYDYEILPERVNKGWSVEMLLKPRLVDEFFPGSGETTLNLIYPQNKNTFFYFGTRAENKFYHHADGSPLGITGYTRVTSGLNGLETCACCNTGVTNSRCLFVYPPTSEGGIYDYHKNYGCCSCGSTIITGSSCNCSCESPEFGTCGWECKWHGCESSIQSTCETDPLFDSMSNALSFRLSGDPKNPAICVKVLTFTGGCETTGFCSSTGITYTTGYTITEYCTPPIYPYCEVKNPSYLNEEHWFQVNVTWERYSYIQDALLGSEGGLCDITTTPYLESLVNNTVALITTPYTTEGNESAAKKVTLVNLNEQWLLEKKYRKGRLKIYVNGRLIHTVNDVEEIIPRGLNTDKEKQVGVPFNISWGGGTQGLRENLTFPSSPRTSGPATFTNSTGGTYQVSGFYTGSTNNSDLGLVTLPNIVNQNVTLPDNCTVYCYGDIEMGSGYTLTIPSGSTLEFVTPDILSQNITLPENSVIYHYGALNIASGYTMTIPSSTTLIYKYIVYDCYDDSQTYIQDPECLPNNDLSGTTISGLTTNILLEQNFGGTFEGGISQFRMYVTPLSSSEVKHNFEVLKDTFSMFNPNCPDCDTTSCKTNDFGYTIN